jgi:hypothetical protein
LDTETLILNPILIFFTGQEGNDTQCVMPLRNKNPWDRGYGEACQFSLQMDFANILDLEVLQSIIWEHDCRVVCTCKC